MTDAWDTLAGGMKMGGTMTRAAALSAALLGMAVAEFSNSQAKLVQTWGLDDKGRQVLTAKVESLSLGVGVDRLTPLVTPERKAVFDRQ